MLFSSLQFIFLFFNYMYVSVLRYMYASVVPTEVKGSDTPRVGVTDHCKPPTILETPNMHVVLCKSRILGHLSGPCPSWVLFL